MPLLHNAINHARCRYRGLTPCDFRVSLHERAVFGLLSACQHGDAYRAGLLLRFLVHREARNISYPEIDWHAAGLLAADRQPALIGHDVGGGRHVLVSLPKVPCCWPNALRMRIACIRNPEPLYPAAFRSMQVLVPELEAQLVQDPVVASIPARSGSRLLCLARARGDARTMGAPAVNLP